MVFWVKFLLSLLSVVYTAAYVLFILSLIQCCYYSYSYTLNTFDSDGELINSCSKTNTLHGNHVIQMIICGSACVLLSLLRSVCLQ